MAPAAILVSSGSVQKEMGLDEVLIQLSKQSLWILCSEELSNGR
jgi:hypothetical protein